MKMEWDVKNLRELNSLARKYCQVKGIKIMNWLEEEPAREWCKKHMPTAKIVGEITAAWEQTDHAKKLEKQRNKSAAPIRRAPKEKAPTQAEILAKNVIRVLVEKNPKRAGTASFERFAVLKDGMTVGEAFEKGYTRADLNWDSSASRQFVRVEEPKTEENKENENG